MTVTERYRADGTRGGRGDKRTRGARRRARRVRRRQDAREVASDGDVERGEVNRLSEGPGRRVRVTGERRRGTGERLHPRDARVRLGAFAERRSRGTNVRGDRGDVVHVRVRRLRAFERPRRGRATFGAGPRAFGARGSLARQHVPVRVARVRLMTRARIMTRVRRTMGEKSRDVVVRGSCFDEQALRLRRQRQR